jgi:hypothetical protein
MAAPAAMRVICHIAGRRAALVEWQMRPFAKGSWRLVAAFCRAREDRPSWVIAMTGR